MKVFVAGATGAVGRRLVPRLVERGHEVLATTRTPAKQALLKQLGATPVLMDGLEQSLVMEAVTMSEPDVIVHQMTSLAGTASFKNFDREFAVTNRLRREGTGYLLAAARAVGARRFVAQSYTGWPNERDGSTAPKTERDRLDPNPPAAQRESLAAIQYLEQTVSEASDVRGVVLRYGSFYGPETSLWRDGEHAELIRKRRFPIVGDGGGIWSLLHIDDAAAATIVAIEGEATGVFNVVDDEPAPVAEWLPYLARVLGAKPPRRLPPWLVKPMLGEVGLSMMTRVRGSSNEKAKRELGWRPYYATWRDGFRRGLDPATAPTTAELMGGERDAS